MMQQTVKKYGAGEIDADKILGFRSSRRDSLPQLRKMHMQRMDQSWSAVSNPIFQTSRTAILHLDSLIIHMSGDGDNRSEGCSCIGHKLITALKSPTWLIQAIEFKSVLYIAYAHLLAYHQLGNKT